MLCRDQNFNLYIDSNNSDSAIDYDIILVADPRYPGGTSQAVSEEINVLNQSGYRVAFVPCKGCNLSGKKVLWNDSIQATLDKLHYTSWQSPDCPINSKLVIFHNPESFRVNNFNRFNIKADVALIIAHQPPADANNKLYYDPIQIENNLSQLGFRHMIWAPVSPVCRAAFESCTLDRKLLDFDWHNLFSGNDLLRKKYSSGFSRNPVVGRHSRPDIRKWPDNKDDLLAVYPESDDIDVQILGWENGLLAWLDHIPSNWTVFGFNELPVNEFLNDLDFYVYFHHPSWRESFGRNIAEAILTGVPCILQKDLQPTFGDAAIYAEPLEVKNIILELWDDREKYLQQAQLARNIFIKEYGARNFIDNLDVLMERIAGQDIDTIVNRVSTISRKVFLSKRTGYYLRRLLS